MSSFTHDDSCQCLNCRSKRTAQITPSNQNKFGIPAVPQEPGPSNSNMQPKIGDRVHFRSICAACQKLTTTHFVFIIDDSQILASLPNFTKRTRLANTEFYIYWDHYFTNIATNWMNLQSSLNAFRSLFKRGNIYGFHDTYLIILTKFGVFTTGPDRNILALPIEEIFDNRIITIVNSSNITHFNYLDLTPNSPSISNLLVR